MEKYFNAFINLFKNILNIFASDAEATTILQRIQDEFNNFIAELDL